MRHDRCIRRHPHENVDGNLRYCHPAGVFLTGCVVCVRFDPRDPNRTRTDGGDRENMHLVGYRYFKYSELK